MARALVNRPAVLLLDEPLGALDLKLRQRLQVELSQIHRDVGTTFVYVTHDQEEAMSMATRIAVMSDGRIEQIGTPSEIYYRPRSRFVADFIGESNFLEVDASERRRGRPSRRRERASRARRTAGSGGATGDADGAARVDPASATRPTHREASLRGRIVQTSFLGSQTRVAVSCDAVDGAGHGVAVRTRADAPRATSPRTGRSRSGGTPDDAVLLPKSQRRRRRSKCRYRRTAQPGRPAEGGRSRRARACTFAGPALARDGRDRRRRR